MPIRHHSERSHRRRQLHDDPDDVASCDSLSTCSSSSSCSSEANPSAKLPALPDLRFEQSYLATIRGFLHEDRPPNPTSPNADDDKTDEKHTSSNELDHHHKVEIARSNAANQYQLWLGNLRVEWFPILYVTVRDQLLSPLVQGAVWGLGGLLYTQLRQYLSARARGAGLGKLGRAIKASSGSILRSVGLNKS